VGEPCDTVAVGLFLLGNKMVELLGKRHLANLLWIAITRFWWDNGKVPA
jgi:hypothetical protein